MLATRFRIDSVVFRIHVLPAVLRVPLPPAPFARFVPLPRAPSLAAYLRHSRAPRFGSEELPSVEGLWQPR